MSQRHLTYLKWIGRVAMFTLVTGLAVGISGVGTAFADSPHIVATVDTAICGACHSVHSSLTTPLLRVEFGNDTRSGACLSCHAGSDVSASNVATGSADSFGLPSGHTLATDGPGAVELEGCTTCHDSHGASSVDRRVPAKEINGVPVSSAGKQLCLACHESSEDWFGAGYPSTSNPTRDATGYPVAGTWPGSDAYESSTNAHRLIPETTVTVSQSEPIRREEGDCLYCHAAHGGANEYDGLVTTFTVPTSDTLEADQTEGSYAALCFKCHGGDRPSGFSSTPTDIKQFATASGTATDSAGGHRVKTSGGTLPVGSPLPCFECHSPHGSTRDNADGLSDVLGGSLATNNAAGVRAFCFTCHSTSDTTEGWDSTTSTFTAVSSADEVVGLPRDGGVLHLPEHDGHALGDTTSCYECHGNDYDTDGNNVHNPGSGQVAPLFAPTIISFSESTTVATSSIDTSASNDASASLDASASADASASIDASAAAIVSNDSTASADASASIETTGGTISTDTTPSAFPDILPPMTLSDALPSYPGSATIMLIAVDDAGGTGVAETYWILDGGAIATGTVVTTSTVGTHTLTFWSVDLAGNLETATTLEFTITTEQAMSSSPLFALRGGQVIAGSGT